MSLLKLKKSFTLMELVIVVVITSVLATLAITNFRKTMQRAREREVINNLFNMFGAARVYKIKKGTYPTMDLLTLGDINTELGLNLVSSDATYYHYRLNLGADTHVFQAFSPDSWRIHFHDGVNYIHCVGPVPCPSCSMGSGTGCGNITNY